MKLIFSEHAKERLKSRRITQRLVRTSIEKPDSILSSYRGRKLLQKQVNDKILEVVVREEPKRITVITAYYLEK